MPEELDPSAQHARQALLEQITQQVTREHSGDDVDVVRAALARGLDEAGFPPQPAKWVDDTASEIAEGRHVIVDRKLMAGRSGGDGVRVALGEDGGAVLEGGNTDEGSAEGQHEEHEEHEGIGEKVRGLLHRRGAHGTHG